MGPGKSAFQTGDWQGSTPWPSTVVRQIGHRKSALHWDLWGAAVSDMKLLYTEILPQPQTQEPSLWDNFCRGWAYSQRLQPAMGGNLQAQRMRISTSRRRNNSIAWRRLLNNSVWNGHNGIGRNTKHKSGTNQADLKKIQIEIMKILKIKKVYTYWSKN